MALLDIVGEVTPGTDPVIFVDRPDTVPSGIVVATAIDPAIVELAATSGGVEQVYFYIL